VTLLLETPASAGVSSSQVDVAMRHRLDPAREISPVAIGRSLENQSIASGGQGAAQASNEAD
jgi:hypothetical protein